MRLLGESRTGVVSVALQHLGLLDLVLDALLLGSPLLGGSPPSRALVFASHIKVDTGAAGRMILVALLST
jgi:hypothetical protein